MNKQILDNLDSVYDSVQIITHHLYQLRQLGCDCQLAQKEGEIGIQLDSFMMNIPVGRIFSAPIVSESKVSPLLPEEVKLKETIQDDAGLIEEFMRKYRESEKIYRGLNGEILRGDPFATKTFGKITSQ